MQNKGALKFLAIALAVACAYQLSFTFVTRHVENKAAQYAAGDAVKANTRHIATAHTAHFTLNSIAPTL